ncbi:MAG: phosphoglucosamine mutase [archaeon]|nr:phosphoglucosamine mutase [Euryarchaeota archaeon]MDP7260481.1 phosphoglucosamine mutase [archaeon]HIK01110.1 phosphoglucosamine mutase [Candidatus Undinarchaeales archaeon ERR594346 U_76725]|tara:strand:+ start:17016 stop:18302 length:1287 start_codon:yes stop_codon:yes gene_type:complete
MKLFGTSGIRGLYPDFVSAELFTKIGLSLGTQAEGVVCVGRDFRTSSKQLQSALVSGFLSTGAEVLDAGACPTPVLAYATKKFKASAGAIITASHNPPEFNGVKLWQSDGSAYSPEMEKEIENLIESGKVKRVGWEDIQNSRPIEALERYMEGITAAFSLEGGLKTVSDCGNGSATLTAPEILSRVSNNVSIFDKPDGMFPNRLSEPSEKNLSELKKKVITSKADVGFAFDGDGDRVAVIDNQGDFVKQDTLLAILAKSEIGKNATIAVPVDTSMAIDEIGAKVIRTKVGDVYVSEALKKEKGTFGGEASGCYIFPEVHLCPDGLLAAMKILETIEISGKSMSELVAEIPSYPILRGVVEGDREKSFKKLSENAKKLGGELSETDGIRIQLEDAWILVRKSGTEEKVRITVEAHSEARARQLMGSIMN